MLMQTIASAASTGQCALRTSRSSGGRMFVVFSESDHSAIERRFSGSGSLGCQASCGNAFAK
jgi:hypothetical protein